MAQIHGSELRVRNNERACILLWASFEDRCLTSSRYLLQSGYFDAIVLHFSEDDYDITENLGSLRTLLDHRLIHEVLLKRDAQLNTFKIMASIIEKMNSYDNVYIDISCFPRDSMLILLIVLLQRTELSSKINVIYNLASDYSTDESDPEKKWLSRGIVSVTPLIGYRGRIIPGRDLCVMGLLGLDDQRFLQMVDSLQPDQLVIGVGTSSDRDREWLTKKNDLIASSIQSAYRARSKFYFDCDSILESFRICEARYMTEEHNNVCILPMNNKISTLAVGVLACRYRNIQICHGSALLYNMKAYSTPGENFILINMQEIFDLLHS